MLHYYISFILLSLLLLLLLKQITIKIEKMNSVTFVNLSYTLFTKLSFFAFEFRCLCRNLTKGAASTNRLTELQ